MLAYIFLAFMALMASADPAPTLPNVEPLSILSWDVHPFPGAPAVNLNDWADAEAKDQDATDFSIAVDSLTCLQTDGAEPNDIRKGIEHLRGVRDRLRNGPEPNNCGRIACSDGAGILWCNDDTKPRTLPSFNNVADGAQAILNRCRGYGDHHKVSGILGHPDKWTVLVRAQNCAV
ncbi:hypothetical protein BDW62DRAFT_200181 [Aspergillus aurantiobrunneus]